MSDRLGEISEIDQESGLYDCTNSWVCDITDRREMLSAEINKQKKCCPSCGTRQIQLIGYMDIIPAQWKCRRCKHKFEWEPDNDNRVSNKT